MTAAVRQGTPAWRDARRALVTATDFGPILGLSPWKAEADLADEKLTGRSDESNLAMRVGTALEPLIASEYTRETGRRVQRIRNLIRHPSIEWAAASPDRRVVGERRLVELKWTGSRSRFADGVPPDVQAQCQWMLGILGWPVCDVAVLIGGRELQVIPVEYDDDTFEGLVDIAQDFRARLAAGGPFSHSLESLKRTYPADGGYELVADPDMVDAVTTLVDLRGRRKVLEADEDRLEVLIKSRMEDAASMRGPGFRVWWKRTKDSQVTDWKVVADGLLRQLPETERNALVGLYTTVKPGFRPMRVVMDKEME
jgi:putative phage-type endonuclease